MSSWTSQMGFPLVTVSEKQLEGNQRELHCQQCRYLEDGSVDDNRPLWQIPIPVAASEEPAKTRAKFLLTKTEDTFVVENIKPEEWLKVSPLIY
jgi:aminopeptidase N